MVPEIQTYIRENALYLLNYKRNIAGRNVSLSIILTEIEDVSNMNKFDEYVRLMYWWLDIAYSMINTNCSRELHISLVMTNLRKKLPSNIIDVLGKINVNTGYTWPCKKDNKIIVYRKEEWFKVFIHETFHALGLDNIQMLSQVNRRVKSLFPVNTEILVGESYCEFWARVIKSCIFSFVLSQGEKTQDKYLSLTYKLINIERVFTLFQGIKVLKFMNLSYDDLIGKDETSKMKRMRFYREETNVFAYYVITMLLMTNYCSFLGWCADNNLNTIQLSGSARTQDSLIKFLTEIHDNKQFLDILNCMTSIYDLHLLDKNRRRLMETTRMSIIDIS